MGARIFTAAVGVVCPWVLGALLAGFPTGCSSKNDARIPVNHRPVGLMCPQQRGPGISEVGPGCVANASLASLIGCTRDSDCTAGTNGRCLQAGGPACNYHCSYDDCSSDSDCSAHAPCACRTSSSDTGANSCATASNCRIDADCGPGGSCSASLVGGSCECISESFCAPNEKGCSKTGPDGVTVQVPCSCGGQCGHGYFCHTPKDSCLNDSDCASGTCNFDLTSQAWLCTGCINPS